MDTPDSLRAYLRLLLTPGSGRPVRTLDDLAQDMPQWLYQSIRAHVPDVDALRVEIVRADAAAQAARADYRAALAAWIDGQQPTVATAVPVQVRGECWQCVETLPLTCEGRLPPHPAMTAGGHATGEPCPGAGRPPSSVPHDPQRPGQEQH